MIGTPAKPDTRPAPEQPVNLWTGTVRAIHAETTKLRTLRLSLYTIVGTVIMTIGLSAGLTKLIDEAYKSGHPEDAAGLESGSAFLVILHYGQIGVILLAAWVVHQENEQGSLRTTLLSTPQRGQVFLAKAVVVATASALTALLSVFGSAGVRCLAVDCAAQVNGFAPNTQAEAGVLWGLVAYWTLIALFTYAIAILLRSGLAAMGSVLALVLVISTYLLNVTTLARFLPDQAGAQLYQQPPVIDGDLGPGLGGLILAIWTLAALGAAVTTFRRQPVNN